MKDLVVCVGESCHQNGAENVVKKFQQLIQTHKLEDEIALQGSFCIGDCCDKNQVSVRWEERIFQVDPETPEKAFYLEVHKMDTTQEEA